MSVPAVTGSQRTARVAAAVVALAGLLLAGCAGSPSGAAALEVPTEAGPVRGANADGVDSFLGIPYAAPPVGPLRWAPPAEPARWTSAREATRFGAPCAAPTGPNGPRTENEDCLFLNVQRPAGEAPQGGRPVLVFIHGGGLSTGSSGQADAAELVRIGDVVAVSMNYRLGQFGFLRHPALGPESGNFGLQDQQAALRWVKRNIAAFGGNPAKVTVAGESAGGWSVCSHLVAPGSKDLFTQAVIQSGSCPNRGAKEAETGGLALAKAVGCADAARATECLRAVPAAKLIDAPSGDFLPVRGTPFLPDDPAKAVAAGTISKVPVLIGANRDEGRTFATRLTDWTEATYTKHLKRTFGADAEKVRAQYPWPDRPEKFSGAYIAGSIITDSGQLYGIGGCPNRALTNQFARTVPTFAYEFDHRTGPGLSPQPAGFEWGAGHAAELAYLFPSFDNGTPIAPTFDADEQRLAQDMKRMWAAFVRSGNPQIEGGPQWPKHDVGGPVLALRAGGKSEQITDAALGTEHHCGFWANRPIPPMVG